jgi:hypothetical protein
MQKHEKTSASGCGDTRGEPYRTLHRAAGVPQASALAVRALELREQALPHVVQDLVVAARLELGHQRVDRHAAALRALMKRSMANARSAASDDVGVATCQRASLVRFGYSGMLFHASSDASAHWHWHTLLERERDPGTRSGGSARHISGAQPRLGLLGGVVSGRRARLGRVRR